jgi:hypothetical protein
MAWHLYCERVEAVRRGVALRDVLRVVARVALWAAASRSRIVGSGGGAVHRGVGRAVTSLRRRSWCEWKGVRWLAAWAALARSSLVTVLAGGACGLVALLLGPVGSR